MTEVVEWLLNNGHLKSAHCPIKRHGSISRYLVNTSPCHYDDQPFSNPEIVGGLYVDMGDYDLEIESGIYVETKDNNDTLVEDAIIIIESVAPDLRGEFRYTHKKQTL